MTWLLVLACALGAVPAGLRWLRIAQREHYLPGSASRFAWRWWTVTPANLALGGASALGVMGSAVAVWPGFLVPLAQIGPLGLPARGRTSPLVWTNRLRRLALLAGALFTGPLLAAGIVEAPFLAAAGLFALPALVDLALVVLQPMERAMGSRWVEQAKRKLAAVGPRVVAITGSYGKTSTKLYTAHLLEAHFRTLATPGSFNNRMGLARAINEGLAPGTEVFVAEMGTYGPGEIAEMCEWVQPEVAAIVSIGPVHLERFGSEGAIVSAKSEILEMAKTGVICVDHHLLASLAAERAGELEVIEVSSGERGRVRVGDEVVVDGVAIASTPEGAFPANLAVALGIGLAMGVDPNRMAERLGDLPHAEHRQRVLRPDSGLVIIDDTFNSNPAGARLGLSRLAVLADGRTAVVTPGMVELGDRQHQENREFARQASLVADHMVIVGRTNRAALLEGSSGGSASVTVVESREEAVAWVRENLGRGDAVLYENDLPDHYP